MDNNNLENNNTQSQGQSPLDIFGQPVQSGQDMGQNTFDSVPPVQSVNPQVEQPTLVDFNQPVEPSQNVSNTFDSVPPVQPVNTQVEQPTLVDFNQPVEPSQNVVSNSFESIPGMGQPVNTQVEQPTLVDFNQPVEPSQNVGSNSFESIPGMGQPVNTQVEQPVLVDFNQPVEPSQNVGPNTFDSMSGMGQPVNTQVEQPVLVDFNQQTELNNGFNQTEETQTPKPKKKTGLIVLIIIIVVIVLALLFVFVGKKFIFGNNNGGFINSFFHFSSKSDDNDSSSILDDSNAQNGGSSSSSSSTSSSSENSGFGELKYDFSDFILILPDGYRPKDYSSEVVAMTETDPKIYFGTAHRLNFDPTNDSLPADYVLTIQDMPKIMWNKMNNIISCVVPAYERSSVKTVIDSREVDFLGFPALREQGVLEVGSDEKHTVQYTAYYSIVTIGLHKNTPIIFLSFTIDGTAEDASALADTVYASAQKID